MTEQQKSALLRWRLILGKGAEGACGGILGLGNLCADGVPGEAEGDGGAGTPGRALDKGAGLQGRGGEPLDSQMLVGIDNSLSFIYDGGQKGASLDGSAPYLPKNIAEWMQDIRRFFPKEAVALVQKDAIERKDLKSLLFEPETMPLLEKNVELVATLLHYKNFIPDKAKELARQLVREIVEEIKKKLENEVRQAVVGALTRNRHSVIPVYRNIDWDRTIRKNLKHYNKELESIIPERFYFWANQLKLYEWQVIVLVDQSGSMGTSIVYSSIVGAIFASINLLKTHLIFFDTEIVDMTPHLNDPVDIIFGARLGGGTDIAKAVAYAADLVEKPEKTIFLLITDLYEGGRPERLLRSLEALVESKVKTLCLLALTDDGKASYDRTMAKKVAASGVHTFGCTPKKLVTVIERIMKGQGGDESATA
ncbi:MAG: VWA domain-containing protein [bacterium]|nr:VWA domain-containing protein [bacterium]